MSQLLRGREDDPRWVRPTLVALLVVATFLYVWDLGASGWANSFYAAAVQAGTKSWKAFFFGSSDAANFITVDKPPASLWVMEISARIFGLSSWSLLVPQALEGVATVVVVYAAVRRWFQAGPALLAAAVTALTPVAVLMFRFDNPDALLVLLLTLAGYATMRAVESGRTRWLVLAGALVGWGFITKELQALLVIPAIGAVYLLAGPRKVARRAWQLLAGALAAIVAGGWWVAAVQLTPAADRPYIGGSQNNSLWNVIFGYNGFGRLTGNESGSVIPGASTTAPGMWGPTGWGRLFQTQMGGQISWLLPAAVAALVVGLWWTRREARTDRRRAALVVWGGTMMVTAAVFSFGQGIIHPYYNIALAPPVAITLAIGVALTWERRERPAARAILAMLVLGTAVWSDVLLGRTPSWYPWLRVVVVAAGTLGALSLLLWPQLQRRRFRVAAAAVCLAAVLSGPLAYSAYTVTQPEAGLIPTAGPPVAARFVVGRAGGAGGRGRLPGFAARGGPGFAARGGLASFPARPPPRAEQPPVRCPTGATVLVREGAASRREVEVVSAVASWAGQLSRRPRPTPYPPTRPNTPGSWPP